MDGRFMLASFAGPEYAAGYENMPQAMTGTAQFSQTAPFLQLAHLGGRQHARMPHPFSNGCPTSQPERVLYRNAFELSDH